MKMLLTLTAALELPTGAALVVAPSLVSSILLGAKLEAPAALTVARIAGTALVALSVGCWLAHRECGAAARGMAAAMLVYNCGVAVLLALAALRDGLGGIALWPAVGLHVVLAGWCLTCAARCAKSNSVILRSDDSRA